jgi:hypothetical protein
LSPVSFQQSDIVFAYGSKLTALFYLFVVSIFFGKFLLVFVAAQGFDEVVDAGAKRAEEVCDAAWAEDEEDHEYQ